MNGFRPQHVTELELSPGHPIAGVTGLDRYASLLGLVRVAGVPLGFVEAELDRGACTSARLTALAATALGERLVERLLAECLEAGQSLTAVGALPTIPSLPRRVRNPLPSLTVAVCTRDRPDDLLGALRAIQRVDYPAVDLLVIDNAPTDDRTAAAVSRHAPGARYVREPRPGLNWARRRAIRETATEVLAFVDDDVLVDPGWARAVGAVFADNPDVMAVTGLVVPYELETRAQWCFERHGGFGRGFQRRWLRRRRDERAGWRFGNAGMFGTGANLSFRRTVFDSIGLPDPALGPGTPTEGADDLDLIFRTIREGFTLVYEPAALVRHRHRRDDSDLIAQIRSWGIGMHAFLAKNAIAHPEEALALGWLAARLHVVFYPRRLAQSLFDRNLVRALTWAQWKGAWLGRRRLAEARRASAADVAADAPWPLVGAAPMPAAARDSRRAMTLDLRDPVPEMMSCPDAEEVTIHVTHDGRRLGSVHVVSGGRPLSRSRVVDTIVQGLRSRLRATPEGRHLAAVVRAALQTGQQLAEARWPGPTGHGEPT